MNRQRPLSVVVRLRLLVAVLLATTIGLAVLAVISIRTARRDLDESVRELVPTYLDSSDLLQEVAVLNGDILVAIESGDGSLLHDVDRQRSDIEQLEDELGAALGNEGDQRPLFDAQVGAIDRWWSYARRVAAGPDSVDGAELTARFDDVVGANVGLSAELKAGLDEDWVGSGNQLDASIQLLVVGTIAAAGLAAFLARRTALSLSQPVQQLRDVALRLRHGETGVRADETVGAGEVRELAQTFNALTVERQRSIAARELTLDIATSLREAESTDAAISVMCERLGSGLATDRCALFTGAPDEPWRMAHVWRRPGLSERRGVSELLRGEATAMATQGILSQGVLVIDDVATAPDIVGDGGDAIASAYGIRALISAPIWLDGTVTGILGVSMDDAPRSWTDAEVHAVRHAAQHTTESVAEREHVASLKALDQQKTDFLATASHELRTPLTSIAGYVELLEDGDLGALTTRQAAAIDVIQRNTRRLRSLIDDILVLNSVEEGGLIASFTSVRVATVLTRVCEVLLPIADAAGVTVACSPVDERVTVLGDHDQLERALVNVVGNAIKFSTRGGHVGVEHELAADGEGGSTIRLICSDAGVGIPASELEMLSTRFYRASNAAALAIPGTGLGLAIARAIVELHGGTLAIESVEGHGTTVTLQLPIDAA